MTTNHYHLRTVVIIGASGNFPLGIIMKGLHNLTIWLRRALGSGSATLLSIAQALCYLTAKEPSSLKFNSSSHNPSSRHQMTCSIEDDTKISLSVQPIELKDCSVTLSLTGRT